MLIKVLQYTGIRRNQLLHIRVCDINELNKTIFLREEGSKTYLEREIPIIDDIFNDLVSFKNKVINYKGLNESIQLFNVYYFKNNKSNMYKEMNFNRVDSFFQSLSKACNIKISPHRFRHTLATNLMKTPDRNITFVKELLGHSSISTTLEYISSDQEQIRLCLQEYFNNKSSY